MGWNMRPRRIGFGKHLAANVSLKKAWLNLWRPDDEDEQAVSWTAKVWRWSHNTRTDRGRWSLPFGIYHLGKKRDRA